MLLPSHILPLAPRCLFFHRSQLLQQTHTCSATVLLTVCSVALCSTMEYLIFVLFLLLLLTLVFPLLIITLFVACSSSLCAKLAAPAHLVLSQSTNLADGCTCVLWWGSCSQLFSRGQPQPLLMEAKTLQTPAASTDTQCKIKNAAQNYFFLSV